MEYINNNRTILNCDPSIESYVQNLTSSYADQSNESSVVATSIIMFVLSAVFFNLSLFSRVSDVSGVLNPTVRLILSTSLSLFLPVMSYLFSEAKNAPQMQGSTVVIPNVKGPSSDLPLRARLILTWMLLVELLRKKVQATLVTAGVQGSSSIVNHVTSVLWLGNLVFFNLKGAGRKAVFGILWVLCATKLVQRITIAELGRRSLAYGHNARLVSSYMAQMLRREEKNGLQAGAHASERLRKCNYVVMGEENMVLKAGPHGYKLDLSKITEEDNAVITVGKIWHLAEQEASRPLKSICLSFALFKMLRRRFEPLPAMTKEETDNCRDLIFEGFCKEEGVADPEVALFQVLNDEVNFLTEYYHSVLPVMFANPYFFLVNYFVVPVVVFGLCIMTVILCSNGNILFAFSSIRNDNYALSFGIITLTKCLWKNVLKSPPVFFSTVDISISYLLFIAFIYEEVWEFIIFVLSNWFSVSLLCTYTANPHWRRSTTFTGAVRRISWVRKRLSHPTLITCKQLSVLRFSWLSMTLPTVSLPKQAKRSIMERLMAYGHDSSAAPLSNGRSVLDRQYPHLLRFCESDSIAEVILIWHIATSLLEMEYPLHKGGTSMPDQRRKVVATRLSKYCSYLVTFHPNLLPDDQEGSKRVYKDMKKDLKEALGCWGYYFLSEHARYKKMMTIDELRPVNCQDDATNVVRKGIELGKELMKAGKGNQGPIWELLADLWLELIVYVAPSGGDEQVEGHEEVLVQGGNQLVTLLWALTTHTGITRSPMVILPVEDVEEEIHPSV